MGYRRWISQRADGPHKIPQIGEMWVCTESGIPFRIVQLVNSFSNELTRHVVFQAAGGNAWMLSVREFVMKFSPLV
jgi:hypothetical protein